MASQDVTLARIYLKQPSWRTREILSFRTQSYGMSRFPGPVLSLLTPLLLTLPLLNTWLRGNITAKVFFNKHFEDCALQWVSIVKDGKTTHLYTGYLSTGWYEHPGRIPAPWLWISIHNHAFMHKSYHPVTWTENVEINLKNVFWIAFKVGYFSLNLGIDKQLVADYSCSCYCIISADCAKPHWLRLCVLEMLFLFLQVLLQLMSPLEMKCTDHRSQIASDTQAET